MSRSSGLYTPLEFDLQFFSLVHEPSDVSE
jgi:hypothetical protein